ncbi:uncharacterized protein N7506_002066 [Penicillium brevicompactum]|uniref:uncharacterized protein n=1 Tax=Penicillium brevicompactum TaxID=5074 RepID=UPI00254242D9|nr:uncharacterized protein N7506_002066 [Penicillium brevicompactum]KAJ5348813.1 hypothetical protein N7506_002066 [Penicillium brevicompactum]
MDPIKDHHGQMANLVRSLETMRTSHSTTIYAMQTFSRTTRGLAELTIDSPMEPMEDINQVNAITTDSVSPIVVFITSPDSTYEDKTFQQKSKWLQESMDHLKDAHEKEFQVTHSEPYNYLPFLHQPNDVLPETHEVPVRLSSVLSKGRRLGAEVVLVISGWRIISSNKLLLKNLFNDWKDVKITLQIFTDIPTRFSRVDGHMLHLVDENIDDSCLPNNHYGHFSPNIRSIRAILDRFSKYNTVLQHRYITSRHLQKQTNDVPSLRGLKRKRLGLKERADQGDNISQERRKRYNENRNQKRAEMKRLAAQGDKIAQELLEKEQKKNHLYWVNIKKKSRAG